MAKLQHDLAPKKCMLLDSKLTDAWHYHESGGIDVVVCTKFGSSILRIPSASLRKWAKIDGELRALREAKGE